MEGLNKYTISGNIISKPRFLICLSIYFDSLVIKIIHFTYVIVLILFPNIVKSFNYRHTFIGIS